MPTPQLENGFTQIANELLEAISKFPFSSRQYSLLLSIIRETYGWHRKSKHISRAKLQELSGIVSRDDITKVADELESMSVVNRTRNGYKSTKYSLNKNYCEWRKVIAPRLLVKQPKSHSSTAITNSSTAIVSHSSQAIPPLPTGYDSSVASHSSTAIPVQYTSLKESGENIFPKKSGETPAIIPSVDVVPEPRRSRTGYVAPTPECDINKQDRERLAVATHNPKQQPIPTGFGSIADALPAQDAPLSTQEVVS